MARKSRVTSLVLDYIAKDDSAIGVRPEKLDEVYDQYIASKDITLLKLNHAESPCIYRLRVFNTQRHWEDIREAFAAVEGAQDGTLTPDDWIEYLRHARRAIRDRIVGCTAHPMVKGLTEKGELEEVIVSWQKGDPEPMGLLDDILSQEDLVANIFRFLVQAASLNEAQKKG